MLRIFVIPNKLKFKILSSQVQAIAPEETCLLRNICFGLKPCLKRTTHIYMLLYVYAVAPILSHINSPQKCMKTNEIEMNLVECQEDVQHTLPIMIKREE